MGFQYFNRHHICQVAKASLLFLGESVNAAPTFIGNKWSSQPRLPYHCSTPAPQTNVVQKTASFPKVQRCSDNPGMEPDSWVYIRRSADWNCGFLCNVQWTSSLHYVHHTWRIRYDCIFPAVSLPCGWPTG